MGTHGAIALTLPHGQHKCVERTMDGNLVHQEAAILWAAQKGPDALINLAESFYRRPLFGTGGIQRDSERERDQFGNFMHVDAKNKVLVLSWLDPEGYDPEEPLEPHRPAQFRKALQRYGWRLVTDVDDCPHP